MLKHLLTGILFSIILSSCISTANNNNNAQLKTGNNPVIHTTQPISSTFDDVDTALITPEDFVAGKNPDSLTDLPRTEDGAFVLAEGFYEADFKSYCLQPGTPGPSVKDAYFQAPLKGYRKDIIETILHHSHREAYLEQKNIQLLLWSVVSRSDFNKLSSEVQSTAFQLLSPKQLFELKGGVIGVAKTVARALPANARQSDLFNLFEAGANSYEAFERMAVLNTPSLPRTTAFKRDQWYKHQDGYFLRYLPTNYKRTKIQVYVPKGLTDSTLDGSPGYIIFDPASMVVVPANSNAQRLGVGAPIIDVVRSVIKVIGTKKEKTAPKPKAPTSNRHPGMEQ